MLCFDTGHVLFRIRTGPKISGMLYQAHLGMSRIFFFSNSAGSSFRCVLESTHRSYTYSRAVVSFYTVNDTHSQKTVIRWKDGGINHDVGHAGSAAAISQRARFQVLGVPRVQGLEGGGGDMLEQRVAGVSVLLLGEYDGEPLLCVLPCRYIFFLLVFISFF